MRVGVGYDVHHLVEGRPLILGGVTIPHDQGLAGYSDADVLTHAIIDALLGAAALGDMGVHFPTGDPQYKDVYSLSLLTRVKGLLREHGWRLVNIDATIVAERPLLKPHIPGMREAVAKALEVEIDTVSIKATTADGLGFVGRGEGIVTHAIVAIEAIS